MNRQTVLADSQNSATYSHGPRFTRRSVIIGLAGATFGLTSALGARQSERRLAILVGTERSDESRRRIDALIASLKALGWTLGENLQVDVRWSDGNAGASERLGRELIALRPDVILAHNTISVSTFLQLTRAIPIVFVSVFDPVLSGFVTSLATPTGNVTGFTNHEQSMGGKWLELLKDLAPRTDNVTLIWNPKTAPYTSKFFSNAFEPAARTLKIRSVSVPLQDPMQLEQTLANLARQKNSALVAMADPFTTVHRQKIIELTAQFAIPAAYPWPFFVNDGGLVAYGPDQLDMWRRAAAYINRILRGSKPSELPVQAPTNFELALNLKTANALGLTIPQSLLVSATEVVQ